jgi:hypothetical protein
MIDIKFMFRIFVSDLLVLERKHLFTGSHILIIFSIITTTAKPNLVQRKGTEKTPAAGIILGIFLVDIFFLNTILFLGRHVRRGRRKRPTKKRSYNFYSAPVSLSFLSCAGARSLYSD